LRDRIVLVVEVPNIQHRALIGRGGRNLNDLQSRTGAQIQFPGSRSYDQVGEAENIAELKDVNPQDLVKVAGPRAACEKAIAELKVRFVGQIFEVVYLNRVVRRTVLLHRKSGSLALFRSHSSITISSLSRDNSFATCAPLV
jgi:hypothetical protein